jgi:hypothetical protein
MYIEAVPNRSSPPAILLRESYRDNGKVKKRTLLNLSDWPPELVEGFRALLKGGAVVPEDQPIFTIKRSLPHGHVAAILGTLKTIGLDRLLGPAGHRDRDLVIAMIVARLAAPTSKLATAKALSPLTATSSLGGGLRPRRASTGTWRRQGWTGSPRCVPLRSRTWSRVARCSSRSSMSAISPASPPTTIRANG